MTGIKPDTSLYTELSDRLRAFSEILESGQETQARYHAIQNGEWTDTGPICITSAARCLIDGTHHYRIKPKLRELWKLCCGDAMDERDFTQRLYAENFKAGTSGLGSYEAVRFVESPK